MVGYITETLYLLIKAGIFESSQGLLYGPFSQIYGNRKHYPGFFIATFKGKRQALAFFGSGIVGGLFEAACSLVQEKVFHTVLWDLYQGYVSFVRRQNQPFIHTLLEYIRLCLYSVHIS